MCQNMHKEVRGELVKIISFLPHAGSENQIETRVIRLGIKHLYLQSHIAGHFLMFFLVPVSQSE